MTDGLEIVEEAAAGFRRPDAAPVQKVAFPSAVERSAVREPVVAEERDVPIHFWLMEDTVWRQGGQIFPPLSVVEHDAVRDPVLAGRVGVGVRGREGAQST